MVGAPFDIEVVIDENVTAALADAERRGTDMTPAMGEISRYMVAEIGERFRTETAPDGVPWKPSLRVSGYTGRDGNRVEGDGGQTLSLKGDLKGSMREDYGRDYAAAGPEASGGAGEYARIHQLGGKITPKTLISGETVLRALNTPFGLRSSVTIPARPYLGINAADQEEFVRIITDHVGVPFAGSLEGGA